ncbi:MAG: tRNA uridine-5-carboxymethylaminomethyl(34) synthesis GTPase MnmE, partial [Burkholderiaceae bacterium]
MLPRLSDPIAAISTAPGRGAVGVVRLSGADLSAVTRALCGRMLEPRHATYLPFLDASGSVLDQGLAIFFPAPHSYTGEDVLELQAHGGTVVLQMLLARCLQAGAASGLRLAQPGEFTQRAFLNDKMDLAQAEAVADLIDAGTERAVRSANRSLSGVFSLEIGRLLNGLIELRMLIEATLDFPEEEVDVLQRSDVAGRLQRLQQRLGEIQRNAQQGALLRDGIKVVIAGPPNAGKSSLLNALAGAELAIVSPLAGTTRDKVQQTIQIEGVPVHVVDTAGLRESEDEIERMGIARTWTEIAAADAIILLHDLTKLAPDRLRTGQPLERSDALPADGPLAELLTRGIAAGAPMLDVWNKLDAVATRPTLPAELSVALSAKTGVGLDILRRMLLQLAGWQTGG